jgi:membrane-anchored glycerophosphoryl diester phosphodiesterase (GDPDase)
MDILGVEFENSLQTLLKFLIYAGICTVLFYLIYLILSKLLYQKSSFKKDITLVMTMQWTFIVILVLFNVLIFFIFRRTGVGNIDWNNWTTLFGFLHIVLLLMLLLTFFYLTHYGFKKKIKNL